MQLSFNILQATGGPSIEFRAGRADFADGAQCPPNGRLPEAEHGCGAAVDELGRLGRNSAANLFQSGNLSQISGYDAGPMVDRKLQGFEAYVSDTYVDCLAKTYVVTRTWKVALYIAIE